MEVAAERSMGRLINGSQCKTSYTCLSHLWTQPSCVV